MFNIIFILKINMSKYEKLYYDIIYSLIIQTSMNNKLSAIISDTTIYFGAQKQRLAKRKHLQLLPHSEYQW